MNLQYTQVPVPAKYINETEEDMQRAHGFHM